jgi:hypothetical protein
VTRRRLVALITALLAGIAGCGGTSKSGAVADAGASLSRIHSGVLHLHLEISAGAGGPSSRVGFQMDGPFDLTPDGATLPVADLTSMNLSDPATPTARFVSTGRDAFVVQDDVGYQLTEKQLAPLRRAGTDSGSEKLEGLDLREWVIDPQQQPASTIAGEAVDRITGRVDPVAALNGIVDLAGQLGTGDTSSLRVGDAEAEHVRAAATSSTFEIATGAQDHLLRALTAQVEFTAGGTASSGSDPANGAVLDRLKTIGHVTLTIELRIERPNSAVSVTPPASIRPISELPKG